MEEINWLEISIGGKDSRSWAHELIYYEFDHFFDKLFYPVVELDELKKPYR